MKPIIINFVGIGIVLIGTTPKGGGKLLPIASGLANGVHTLIINEFTVRIDGELVEMDDELKDFICRDVVGYETISISGVRYRTLFDGKKVTGPVKAKRNKEQIQGYPEFLNQLESL